MTGQKIENARVATNSANSAPEKRLGYFTNEPGVASPSTISAKERSLEALRADENYSFAKLCIDESRSSSSSEQERQSNRRLALEYLEKALTDFPTSHQIHLQRGLLCLEDGLSKQAVNSLRLALMFGPENHKDVIGLLVIASEMLNTDPNKRAGDMLHVSLSALGIQHDLARGKYQQAFESAHAEINQALDTDQPIDLWTVQLMRIAAMQSAEERTYVASLIALEQRGLLNASDPEYLPIGSQWSHQRYDEFREELSEKGGWYQRSALWEKFKIHDVAPINATAVNVGPGAAKRQR